jgi:hypothetical protein
MRFPVVILLAIPVSACGPSHTTLFQCQDGSLLEVNVDNRVAEQLSVQHGEVYEQLSLRSHSQGTLYEGRRYRILLRDDHALLDTGSQKMDCRLKGFGS